jgi:sterol desaturase/sphingolipid hydroxylase (fatty acid hydroxylase superfamily)
MEMSSEALVGFAAFLTIGLWEIWRPYQVSDAGFGWRWASHIIVYASGGFAAGWLVATVIGPAWKAGLPDLSNPPLAALSLAFAVLVLDLERYWLHRLLHSVPVLWRCHALHHSDREIDVSTGYRHHPFEIVVVALVLPLSALALGIPGASIIAYGAVDAVAADFQHGNVTIPRWLERILAPVIVTPAMHRVHHSMDRSEADSNFGQIFSFWDRLFATYTPPALDGSRIEFGVAEFTRPADQRLAMMMLTPFLIGTRRALDGLSAAKPIISRRITAWASRCSAHLTHSILYRS